MVTVYGSTQVWNDYTYTAATQSAMSSPAPGSVLIGPRVTFNWSPGTQATSYGLWLGTTVGSNNVYGSGTITTASVTPANLPTNGGTIHARLFTHFGASQVYTDYIYTAATAGALTSPTPSTVLAGPKVTFSWTTSPGATDYSLRLGTTVGGNDVYSTGLITATYATPTNLPTNGETICARLYTFYGSAQVFTDYVFTAATRATLASPVPSTVLTGPKITFEWSTGTGASGYGFRLGTTVGASNIYSSGTTTSTSVTPTNLPTNGETIYARLFTFYGTSQVYTDYVFTSTTRAALISPAPSTVLTGAKVTFTWSAATGATDYALRLGTTVGGNDLYASGPITATSATPSNLPTNGETIHARLTTFFGASQVYTDYVYTAAP